MSKTFYLIIFVFICSCKTDKNNNSYNYWQIINNNEKYKKSGFEAIRTGDTILYDKVAKEYFNSTNPQDLFFFANMMASKHQYRAAYCHIYFLSHFFCSKKDTNLINYTLYNYAKSIELKDSTFRFAVIESDTILKESIKPSEYYLDKLK